MNKVGTKNKTVLALAAAAILAAVPLLCRRALRRSNTQVHRINQ